MTAAEPTIRAMTNDDLLAVCHIISADYRKIAADEGYTSAETDRLIAERGSPDALSAQRLLYDFRVALMQNTVVGVVAVQNNEITKLYISPEHSHRGIGTFLFRETQELIRIQKFDDLILGAFPTSVGFYEKMGMTISGRKVATGGPIAGQEIVLMRKIIA